VKTFVASWVCSLTLLLTATAGAQAPRVLGVWEVDPAASSLPPGVLVASETRSYDLRSDGYLVNLTIKVVAIAPNGQEMPPITLVFKRVS
jgi:hypothetical protein